MNVFVLFMLHLLLSCEFKTKQTSQTLAHVIEIKLPPHQKNKNKKKGQYMYYGYE